MKVFAEGVPRNEQGWLLFPQHDRAWRKRLFSPEVFKHIAKANLHMLQALIEYLTEPGDTILDPFAGTGSILIASTMGRNVVMVELEEHFVDLISKAMSSGWEGGNSVVLHNDCRLVLPFPCDAVITSPPYASTLHDPGKGQKTQQRIASYSQSYTNMGKLNPFLFVQAMRTVFNKLALSVKPGGPVAIITKDLGKGRRVFLSERIVRYATEAGLVLSEWHKWLPPGNTFPRQEGECNILDEDLIIFRRPQ